MPKRKRPDGEEPTPSTPGKAARTSEPTVNAIHVQIVAGSYERALHGITASVPIQQLELKVQEDQKASISFTDSFLFNAHASAIRCLALSPLPPKSAISQKVILATGGSDEKINIFHLSTRPPRGPVLPTLGSKTQQNPHNKSLGTLHTHDATITALHFPNKTKLLSSCEKNIIAVTSTRDFNTLSLIKAPNPKHPNRPTGDTSTASTLPAGVNDFAVHPSLKLMISVGKAERSMRLWNLVTGRKAGVLNFEKELLKQVNEATKGWGSGEGRKIIWAYDGEEFVVAFERGALVFGMDCEPTAKVAPSPVSKFHQIRYVPGVDMPILAVSTEDGRILFYDTSKQEPTTNGESKTKSGQLPSCQFIGQLGGKAAGLTTRIKDFDIVSAPSNEDESTLPTLIVVTGGSDGSVRLWALEKEELSLSETKEQGTNGEANGTEQKTPVNQIGRLLGAYETHNRITCLKSFVLTGEPEDEDTINGAVEEDDVDDSDEDSEDGSGDSDDSQ